MFLPLFIAKRYLFAKKSHNVINIISAISVLGMAIGTASLIIILSIFNGFSDIVEKSMSNIEPDILIKSSKGKVFIPDEADIEKLKEDRNLKHVNFVLEDRVYISYRGKTGIAKIKGVDSLYGKSCPVISKITSGKFKLYDSGFPQAVVGIKLATDKGINPSYPHPMEVYYPDRNAKTSFTDITKSLNCIDLHPAGIFYINGKPDGELIFAPMEAVRELFGYTSEISGIELRFGDSRSIDTDRLKSVMGEKFEVLTRTEQNPTLYKMMQYEKLFVYVIMLFIILIVAFNIFGCLTMLIIEKKDDIKTMIHLGADKKFIRKVFVTEGWMISLSGLIIGLAIGLSVCLIQINFGIVKMPDAFMQNPYPLIINPWDILICVISIGGIGYVIALVPALRIPHEN